jgi:tRNA modification GTPase
MRGPTLPLDADTIVAVSTPFGVGGIGIVRISGPDAERIARRLFEPKSPSERLPSHRLAYGHVCDPRAGSVVDEALVVIMRAPRTYTRQDVAEIHCHGGAVAVRRVLELVVAEGARPAEPGEFTRRAFLNGRIDLVQAEAVADIVEAKSEAALRFAQRQLQGGLSEKIRAVRDLLKDVLIETEAWLDFPEEDLPEPDLVRMRMRIEEGRRALGELADSYAQAHLYRDGVSLVIGGRPNVGKSTLLNVLVGRERAIVSPVPGTTRDYLEEAVDLDGMPVRMIDTAGLREQPEEIEARGIAFARSRMETADLLLYVADATQLDSEPWDRVAGLAPAGRTLLVLNKIDLVGQAAGLEERAGSIASLPCVAVSALNRTGIERLKEEIRNQLLGGRIDLDFRAVITNLRHRKALERCLEALEGALRELSGPSPMGDLLAADLRHGLRALGEILGQTTPEEILRGIFDRFCVGK